MSINFERKMTMKQRLKRLNRGIVLGVLVMLAFAIYITVDNAMFKSKEKDEIEKVISGFVNDAAQACVYTGSATDKDSILNFYDKQADPGCKDALNKYWDHSEALEKYNEASLFGEYYTTKDDIVQEMTPLRDYMDNGYATPSVMSYFSKIDCTTTIESLKRNGAGATAIITVRYDATGSGVPILVCPVGVDYIEAGSGSQVSTSESYRIELYKQDGEWKIVGSTWN